MGLRYILEKTYTKVNLALYSLLGIAKITNELFEKHEIEIIERHIKHLEYCKSMTPFERNNDWGYGYLKERYEEQYCPQDIHHKELSWENQQKYLWLRLKIDEALENNLFCN